MVNDVMATNRMIGMVQPRDPQGAKSGIYDIGCAGKITEFNETPDGRFMITLTGICRFKIEQELDTTTLYRRVKPQWDMFRNDLETMKCQDLNRAQLHTYLKQYFSAQNLTCDWEKIKNTEDNKLITCLSMVCPFSPQEKQALLEARCCNERARIFMAMLEMAVYENNSDSAGQG